MAMISTYYSEASSKKGDLGGFSSMFADTTRLTPHDMMLAFGSKILSKPGVVAWKDIDLHMIGKDTVYFKGTAYFKNISDESLSSIDSSMKVYNDDKGQTIIELKQKKDTGSSYASKEYKKLFKGGGVYYSYMHYYMAVLLRDINISVTYHLPGKIVSCSNFAKINDNTAELSINGKNMMASLDTLLQNTDMISKMYSNPSNIGSMSSTDPYKYNSLFFSENKPIRVTYKAGDKPQFDYAKEVAEAKIYYANFLKKSGIAAFDSLALIKIEKVEAEKRKEHGTLVLTSEDSANGKIYFKELGANQYSYSSDNYLSFTGTLSRPVSASNYALVSISYITSDNGTNLTDSLSNSSFITAYLSSSSYNYSDTSSVSNDDKVSFSLSGHFPDDTKFINLQGTLKIDTVTTIPFKITKLYLSKKNGFGEEEK